MSYNLEITVASNQIQVIREDRVVLMYLAVDNVEMTVEEAVKALTSFIEDWVKKNLEVK